MSNNWLEKNTFHYSDFKDLFHLVEEKQKKNLLISLCLPTLNEENTIAKEIIIMKSELMTRYPLVDEIVVIDSGSTDNTVEIAKSFVTPTRFYPILKNLKARVKTCGKPFTLPKETSLFISMPILKIFTTALPMG